ncbi:MAG TPA: Fe-S oxidoreductase, partial [Flavobacterium sp.]
MSYLDNILFAILLAIGLGYFVINVRKLMRNINIGQPLDRSDNPGLRWGNMARVALGQSKMVKRPVAAFLHVLVYLGFIIINIELLEIIIDGLTGSHRVFASLGGFYNVLIGSFEILALLVLIAVIAFLARRDVKRVDRLRHPDLQGYPQ